MSKAKRNGLYHSYVFKGKDPVIDSTRTIVEDSGESYAEVARRSGVSTTTLHNWFAGGTRRPQFCTVNAVGRALGYELKWSRFTRAPGAAPARKKP